MNSLLHSLAFLLLAASSAAQCPPVLLQCPAAPQNYCDQSPNNSQLWNASYWWDPVYSLHDLPEGTADLSLSVLDTCNAGNTHIRYTLELDLDADGTRETLVDSDSLPGWNRVYFNNANADSLTGGTAREFDKRPVLPEQKYGFALQTLVSGDTLTARVRWNTQQAPDNFVLPELPYGGTHRIVWTVTQGGVEKTCGWDFTITDCQKPTIVCVNGLNVNIMPTMMVVLWNTDFLQYAEDNVSPASQLEIGIRASGTGAGFPVNPDGTPQAFVQYTCNDLGTQLIELWARDKAGNADYCETYVIVQDNASNCTGDPGPELVCVQTAYNNLPMEGVGIAIEGSNPSLPPVFWPTGQEQTGVDGCWSSPGAIPFGADYTFTPLKDNDPLNGVSTFDLILINKHILAIEPLNNPYKLIAADANNSRSITTFDIIELRKLILGIYTEFPHNTSWRFVPKNYAFPNPANPFQEVFPESISTAAALPAEFLGIKIGDVNGNAVVNLQADPEDRTTAALALPDLTLGAGQTLETPLYIPLSVTWAGMQFALEFDPSRLELEAVFPENIPGLGADAYARPRPGLLTFSWFTPEPLQLESGTVFLKLRWRAKAPVRLSNALHFSASRLHPEAYTAEERVQNLALLFGVPADAGDATVFAPRPNPTSGAAVLPLSLTQSGPVRLELFDANGRLLYQWENRLDAGMGQLEIPAAAMPQTGVYWWRVQIGEMVQRGKMVRL